MIDVKQAAEIARTHLIDLLGDQEVADKKAITLEEFELSSDGKTWNVTLGYPVRETRPLPAALTSLSALTQEPKRRFKIFRIASKDGKLILPRQESFASLHILTRRASEGTEALPSLARRVSMSFFGARVIGMKYAEP